MAWFPLGFTSELEVRKSLSDLSTVASAITSNSGKILGTAFPIFASKTNTMMLTAGHVIEEGFTGSPSYSERKNARKFNHIPAPDNEKYEQLGNWARNSKELWCLL